MPKYLIDVNLPCRFALWASKEYKHIINIDDTLKDSEIWEIAKKENLTIVTKDADFSEYVLLNDPPPRVIHIKFGNMKINDFHQLLNKLWSEVCDLSNNYKLVRVYKDKLEGID